MKPGNLLLFFIQSTIFLFLFNCEPKIDSLADLYAERTINTNRQRFYKQLIDQTIEQNLRKDLHDDHEEKWQGAFWGMGLAGYRSSVCDSAIPIGLNNFSERSASFQRSLLEVIYGLYPDSYPVEIDGIIQNTSNKKIFAMGVEYLSRIQPGKKDQFIKILEQKFSDVNSDPILIMLKKRLEKTKHSLPPIRELVTKAYDNKLVIFSFHRENRNYAGLTLIKKPNGEFLRNPDGSLFRISHLARSNSGLPGYITNGNTPEGIYSLQGTDISDNVFIGPTSNLQLRLPFETSVANYFHKADKTDDQWRIEHYRKLLPESWQDYFPIYEAFYAGQAGRSAIIAHGTTINPLFYQDQSYYPFTPSLGCLTALEFWSGKNGECLYSEQLALIKNYRRFDPEGYLILIDIDNQKSPVTISEVIDKVIRIEKMNVENK
jgi:hypothetical protein